QQCSYTGARPTKKRSDRRRGNHEKLAPGLASQDRDPDLARLAALPVLRMLPDVANHVLPIQGKRPLRATGPTDARAAERGAPCERTPTPRPGGLCLIRRESDRIDAVLDRDGASGASRAWPG